MVNLERLPSDLKKQIIQKEGAKKKKNRGKENIIEIDQENVSELEDVCLQVDRVYWMSSRIVKKITQAHSKVHYCLIDKEMTY